MPRASPSPQRERSPILFAQHDQRPSAAASDMISFSSSDGELDDNLSLAASDAEELAGSVTDPAPLAVVLFMQRQTHSGWWAHPRHDKGCQWAQARMVSAWGNIKLSANTPPQSSPKSMISSQNRGESHTRLASVHLLLPFSHPLTVLKRKDTSACSLWMNPWPHISVRPRLSDGWLALTFHPIAVSHICTRWTCLLGGWTSGFDAALYGCASGLPGQNARQWGSRSWCSFTQGPEERKRPGSTRLQSLRPSHWAFDIQPDSVRAPPLAHDDGDERGRQSSLPRCSGFVRQPVWTSCGGPCGMLHGGSEVVSSDATLPPETHQLFCCWRDLLSQANGTIWLPRPELWALHVWPLDGTVITVLQDARRMNPPRACTVPPWDLLTVLRGPHLNHCNPGASECSLWKPPCC